MDDSYEWLAKLAAELAGKGEKDRAALITELSGLLADHDAERRAAWDCFMARALKLCQRVRCTSSTNEEARYESVVDFDLAADYADRALAKRDERWPRQ